MSGTDAMLVPSINFSMLCPGVYRSGYPTKKNFPFLQALKLRTICYLCPEEYAPTNQKFCEEHDIRVVSYPMEGNKEPFVDIPEPMVHQALGTIVDTRHHPVLIHCNKGKHRTGVLCGCLRKLQGWSLSSVFEEYNRFAGDKGRVGDQQFMELYRPMIYLDWKYAAPWLSLAEATVTILTEAAASADEGKN